METETITKRRNIFVEFFYSLFKFNYYPNLTNNKGIKIFGHGFLLSLLAFLPVLIFFLKLNMSIGSIPELIDTYVPNFEISNGTLYLDETYQFIDIENNDYYIVIDTSQDFTEEDFFNISSYGYQNIALVDSKKIIGKSSKTSAYTDLGDINIVTFEEIFEEINDMYSDSDLVINRDTIKDVAKILTPILFGFLIFLYIFCLIGVFLITLIKTILTLIIASILKIKIYFVPALKLTIYATTIIYLLSFVVSLLNITIPVWGLIKLAILCFYIVKSLKAYQEQIDNENKLNSEISDLNSLNNLDFNSQTTNNYEPIPVDVEPTQTPTQIENPVNNQNNNQDNN